MKFMAVNVSRLTLVALAVVASGAPAWAQNPPNIGDVLQQTKPPLAPERERTLPPSPLIGGNELPAGPPLKELPTGPRIEVRQFAFTGNQQIPSIELNALVDDQAGKSLTLEELEALALRVTRFYRNQGYFVARAYIPEQEVSEGAVTIRVIEGAYGKFVLENDSRVRDDVLQGILDDVRRKDAISVDTLERALLTINDTPGVEVARADVVPGAAVGTSDLVISTRATSPYRGYLLFDNHGSAYTGRNRVSFNTDILSPTGRGDRLTFGGLAGGIKGDLLSGRIAYSALLAPNGLRAELALGRTQYALAGKYEELGAKGAATGVEAMLTYPLRRNSEQTVEATLTGAHRRLEDRFNAGTDGLHLRKSITSLTAGLNLLDNSPLFGLNGLTQTGVALTVGKLSFHDQDPQELARDEAGAGMNGSFTKITASLARVTMLPNKFTMSVSARLQHALNGKNLHGSENLVVSGAGGVSAYPMNELAGSNAAVLRVELSRPLPTLAGFNSKWQVFYDWGEARAARPLGDAGHSRSISDVGVGINADYRNFRLRLQAAHRLQAAAPLSEPIPRTRVLAQAGLIF